MIFNIWKARQHGTLLYSYFKVYTNNKGAKYVNLFAQYNEGDETFHNFFVSVRRSVCFRRVFRPSSGAQNCTYSDKYLTLYVQF